MISAQQLTRGDVLDKVDTHQPIAQASSADKTVYSFDIFDTLLVRKLPIEAIQIAIARQCLDSLQEVYSHSLSVEQFIGLREEAFNRCRQDLANRGYDKEPRLADVLVLLIGLCSREASISSSSQKALIQQWLEIELRIESWSLEPTRLLEQCRSYRRQGKRLIAVSDMYLSSEQLSRLLADNSYGGLFDAVYSSADYHMSKASGRLFDEVFAAESIEPDQLKHVGDNEQSDVIQLKRRGGHSKHWVPAVQREHAWFKRLQWRSKKQAAESAGAWVSSTYLLPSSLADETAFTVGASKMGPVLCQFIHELGEWAQAEQIDTLYFMAREGNLFKQIYDTMAPFLWGDKAPQSVYLCVSRQSVTCPADGLVTTADLDAIRINSGGQVSLEAYLKGLFIPSELHASLAQAHGFDSLDTLITEANTSQFEALLQDQETVQVLQTTRHTKRTGLMAYLQEVGLFNDTTAGLVDIGWGGQIQDKLTTTLAEEGINTQLKGFYLGLNSLAIPRKARGVDMTASSLATMEAYEWIGGAVFETLPLWETICQAFHATTKGYDPQTGEVQLGHYFDAPLPKGAIHAGRIQQGILSYAKHYAVTCSLLGIPSTQTANHARMSLARLFRFPSIEEATLLQQLPYSKGMGSDAYEHLAPDDITLLERIKKIARPCQLWREADASYIGSTAQLLVGLYKAARGLYQKAGSELHNTYLPEQAIVRSNERTVITPRADWLLTPAQPVSELTPVEEEAWAKREAIFFPVSPNEIRALPPSNSLYKAAYLQLLACFAWAINGLLYGKQSRIPHLPIVSFTAEQNKWASRIAALLFG